MVAALLDTNILVDFLRDFPPAVQWLSGQQPLGVTHIVWLELLEGVADRATQRRAVNLLRRFELVELTPVDLQWAVEHLMQFKLSHNAGMMDCLIAAASQRLQIPLYTQNLKHLTWGTSLKSRIDIQGQGENPCPCISRCCAASTWAASA